MKGTSLEGRVPWLREAKIQLCLALAQPKIQLCLWGVRAKNPRRVPGPAGSGSGSGNPARGFPRAGGVARVTARWWW